MISAVEVKNVSIFGGGEIDGSGLDFWFQVEGNKKLKYPSKFKYPKWRPAQMLFFLRMRKRFRTRCKAF